GRADHPVLSIGKEDRAAIGSQYAKHDARCRSHHRVVLRALTAIAPVHDDDVRRVDLVDSYQLFHGLAEPASDAATIFIDLFAIVIGAETDVQAAIDALRGAALACE